MDQQTAFLIAVLGSVGVSALIVGFLWRPLYALLADLCGTESRARFWRCYTCIMLLLVPLAAVLLGRSEVRSSESAWVAVADQARWAVVGQIVALFVVAIGVGTFIQRKAVVSVNPDQVDDLRRLLDKVEEIRARQILRRGDEPETRRA
jgi:hypothetical protein